MFEQDDNPVALFEGWAVIIALVVVGVAAVAIASALLLAWTAFAASPLPSFDIAELGVL